MNALRKRNQEARIAAMVSAVNKNWISIFFPSEDPVKFAIKLKFLNLIFTSTACWPLSEIENLSDDELRARITELANAH